MVFRLVWVIMIPVTPVSDSVAYDTFAHNFLSTACTVGHQINQVPIGRSEHLPSLLARISFWETRIGVLFRLILPRLI